LPENLREIAKMRLAYSDATLKELGEMLNLLLENPELIIDEESWTRLLRA